MEFTDKIDIKLAPMKKAFVVYSFVVHCLLVVTGLIRPSDDDCRWWWRIVDGWSLLETATMNPLQQSIVLDSVLQNMSVDFLNDRRTLLGEVCKCFANVLIFTFAAWNTLYRNSLDSHTT